MNQTFLGKTREEQDKDFVEYFRFFADRDCKICYGTGKKGWLVDLHQYIICECVMVNIEKEKQKQENLITKVEIVN